jgi:hypothetical protein
MPAGYRQRLEYFELEEGLEISFRRKSRVTLSDVGIVSISLHRMLNKTAARLASFPEPFFQRQFSEPLLVQAVLTGLSYESFSAKTRIQIYRDFKDFGISVAASIVATFLFNCCESHLKNAEAKGKNMPQARPAKVDVGRNLATMTNDCRMRVVIGNFILRTPILERKFGFDTMNSA